MTNPTEHPYWSNFVSWFQSCFNREPTVTIQSDLELWRAFANGANSTQTKEQGRKFVTNTRCEGAD